VRSAITKFKPYLLTRLREAKRFDVHHQPPPDESAEQTDPLRPEESKQ
jgi:hypothetical protein